MANQSNDSPMKTQISPLFIRSAIVILVVLVFIWNERHPVVPVYRANATIQVTQRMDRNLLHSDVQNSEPDYYLRRLNTIVGTLANTDLMKQVITDNDLLNNETFAGRDASSASLGILARSLVGRTSATLREGTELIDVRIVDGDRELASNLVNLISLGFIKQHGNRKLNVNRYANSVLTNEAERLKIKLRNAEVALIDFRRSSGLVVSLEERQSIVGSRVASLHQLKDNSDREVARLKADLDLLRVFGDEPSVAQFEQIPSVWNSGEVNRYRNMLAEVEMKADESSLQYDESHPVVVGNLATLKRVKARLFESMKERANRLDADYMRTRRERDVLSEQLKMAEQESLTLSENAVEYNVLEREVAGTKTLYVSVLERIREIDLTTGLMEEVITVIEPASSAADISSRGSSRFWGSGLTGLVLALAGIFIFDHLLPRLKPKS
jgi:uncharacterized protein involved in exopolysaccharide biosynthesis